MSATQGTPDHGEYLGPPDRPCGCAVVAWTTGKLPRPYWSQPTTCTCLATGRAPSTEPLHIIGGLTLTDAEGRKYHVEHAGVWDPPEGDDRPTVYYEDEEIPPRAVSLYRLVVDEVSE